MNVSSEANKSLKDNNETLDICIDKQNLFDTSRVKSNIDYVSKLAYENINYIIAGAFFIGVAGLRYYYNQPQEKQVNEVFTNLHNEERLDVFALGWESILGWNYVQEMSIFFNREAINIFQSGTKLQNSLSEISIFGEEQDVDIYTSTLDFESFSCFQSITGYSVNKVFSSTESLNRYLLNDALSELSKYTDRYLPNGVLSEFTENTEDYLTHIFNGALSGFTENTENYLTEIFNDAFSELYEYISENSLQETDPRIIAEGFMKDINMIHPIVDLNTLYEKIFNGAFSESSDGTMDYLLQIFNDELYELSEYISENSLQETDPRVIAEGFMKDINMNHPIVDRTFFNSQIFYMINKLHYKPGENLDEIPIIQNFQYQLGSLSLTDEVKSEFYNNFINRVKSCIDPATPGFNFRIDGDLYGEYLMTVMLLSSTIAKASSEEENTNNNATTWNALSLSTDVDDNETDYTTHPKLIIESIAEIIEESDIYDYPTFVSNSYENDLCKFSLKKTVSDASYYLEAYNFFMNHKSPSKDIYSLSKANQFVFIPALLLMSDKLIDNFCDIIEDTCEHTLDFLGIEHSSISIDVDSL